MNSPQLPVCPKYTLIRLLAGVLVCVLVAAPSSSRAREPEPVLLESTPQGARFQVSFDAPERKTVTLGDAQYPFLYWEGCPLEGDPGEPALPVVYARVAVPLGVPVSLDFDTDPRGSGGGFRFPPSPGWEENFEVSARLRETVPRTRIWEGPGYRSRTARPFAEIVGDGVERGLRVVTVAVRPVTWTGAAGRAEWVSAVRVEVRWPEPRGLPPTGSLRSGDQGAGALLARSVLNSNDTFRLRPPYFSLVPAPPGANGVPDAWFDDTPGWVKIEIETNGVYRLTRNELQNLGIPTATLDPRTLRMYAGPLVPEVGWAAAGWDSLPCSPAKVITRKAHVYEKPGFIEGIGAAGGLEQVAIWVPGEEDGSLDASDQVVFYALGPDNYRDRLGLEQALEPYFVNPYTSRTVYWLTWGGGSSETPLRMDAVSAPPGAGAPVTVSRNRVREERNSIYDPSLYKGGYRWEGWFWEYLASDSGIQRFRIDLPHAAADAVLDAQIRLWGSNIPTPYESGEASRHHVQVTVNGESAGITSWGGRSAVEALTPQDVFVTGIPTTATADFQFLLPAIPSSDPRRLDQVHLTWIEVTYDRELELDGSPGELRIDSGAAGRTVTVGTVPTGTPLVFDVTDARHPRRLTDTDASGGGATFSLASIEGAVVAVTSDGALRTPARAMRDDPPRTVPGGPVKWLREADAPLDYVIVTYDDFEIAAEILADWRRQHLYPYTPDRPARVRVVRVSDIYDEFSWGMKDPAAIREFLEYVFRYYGDPGDDRLLYAVFLGDATYDPRDYGESGKIDYVPSWEDNRENISNIANGNVQYVSDDPLAQFDSPDSITTCPDAITDLIIGRIPVSSVTEARDLILNKVIRSEENPEYGPWRAKAILVADDICQGLKGDGLGWAHVIQMEAISRQLPPVFDQEKIYLTEYGTACIYVTKPEAKQDLLASWREGAWLVNYVGHGADVVWADEHVLDLADTPTLENGVRLPVVGSFSCSVGKFSNPQRDGLGEAHFRTPGGGSLVSAAATHLTSSVGNSAFNQEFLKQLFINGADNPLPIGVALMNAKRVQLSQGDKYVCLGDPASRLPVPHRSIEVEGPPSLERGAQVSIGTTVDGGDALGGTLDLIARDEPIRRLDTFGNQQYWLPGATLFRGRSQVAGDTSRVGFTVPASLRGGTDGMVRAYGWGAGWDALGALKPIAVGTGTGVTPSDSLGPLITFSAADGRVSSGDEIEVVLEDPSGINLTQLFEFRSVFLKVTDGNGLEQYRQDLTEAFAYDMGSSTRGSLVFMVPDLSPGSYSFSVSAFDNYNNRTQQSVTYEVGAASGAARFVRVQGAYPNPMNPEQGPTQLVFTLDRSTRVTARVYSVSGRLVRTENLDASSGVNAFVWDGRDRAGDAVANGVYLILLTASGGGGGESARHLERLVVLR